MSLLLYNNICVCVQELVALAFAATKLNIPCVPTRQEENEIRERAYKSCLTLDGTPLPDPFMLDVWELEKDSMQKWRPVSSKTFHSWKQICSEIKFLNKWSQQAAQ